MLRTATQILQEIFEYVEPPQGVAIDVIESFSGHANYPNCTAEMGFTDAPRKEKFSQKMADLKKTDANVDWSSIEEHVGRKRHVTRWLSPI
jgi:hypothetical protein